jgi:hypothetical protein
VRYLRNEHLRLLRGRRPFEQMLAFLAEKLGEL